MSLVAVKPKSEDPTPAQAKIIALKIARKSELARKSRRIAQSLASNFIPPLVCAAVILLIWQIAFGRAGATLPSPLVVWKEASRTARRTSGSAGAR
jgi:hypothetical protein